MALHEALINVQSALKAPKSQTNTFGKYNYRSCEDILEAVKPLLKANGLTLQLSDELECVGDRVYIKATATLSDGTEIRVSTALAREPETKKGMDDSQITGTASSYARKYALNGLFCIDDTKDADADAYTNQTKGASSDQSTNSQIKGTPVNQSTVNPPVCADCGCVIAAHGERSAQEMAKAAKDRFRRVLCIDCGREEAARQESAS